MRKILIWPGIVGGLFIVYLIYDHSNPCDSGFFIGGCTLEQFFLLTLFSLDLLIYFLLIRTNRKSHRMKNAWPGVKTGLLLGILSVALLLGVSVMAPGIILLLIFVPMWVLQQIGLL